MGDLRLSIRDIIVHKFCMYFSTKLGQNGNLLDNYWGFKYSDITKELKRCSSVRCYYCCRRGASIYCANEKCQIKFHLPCGIENDSFHYYHDEKQLYLSFCRRHRPKIEVPELQEPISCTICQETAEITDRYKLMFFNCCRSYFHRTCLKDLTFHQGEMLIKCPNCNNKTEFVNQLKEAGFFIPQRGPSWGLPGYYSIDRMIYQCVAAECKSEFGRLYSNNTNWRMFCCNSCGSNWMHVGCIVSTNENFEREWICEHCV